MAKLGRAIPRRVIADEGPVDLLVLSGNVSLEADAEDDFLAPCRPVEAKRLEGDGHFHFPALGKAASPGAPHGIPVDVPSTRGLAGLKQVLDEAIDVGHQLDGAPVFVEGIGWEKFAFVGGGKGALRQIGVERYLSYQGNIDIAQLSFDCFDIGGFGYGLPTFEQQGPSPAERYLQNKGHKNPSRPKIKPKTICWVTVGVVAIAVVQWLIAMLLCRWSNVVGLGLFPLILVAVVARIWPNPRILLYLLIGFNLAGWILRAVFGSVTPSLLGELLRGNLTYLLLVGLEVLLGLGIMLLPDRRAAGVEIKGLNRKT